MLLFDIFLKFFNARSISDHKLTAVFLLLICTFFACAHPDIEARIQALSEQIKAEPTKGRLYLARGIIHSEHHNWQQANKDLIAARKLGVSAPLVLLHQARLLKQQGQLDPAEHLLAQALTEFNRNKSTDLPLQSQLHLIFAEIKEQNDQWLIAAEHYSQAIALWQNNSIGVYLSAAKAYQKAGQKYQQHALTILDNLLSRKSGVISAHNLAISIEISRKNDHSAIIRLKALLKRYPNLKAQKKLLKQLESKRL